MVTAAARYPYETPITAYGNSGFRFAEMSHRGSIFCTPAGVFAWNVSSASELKGSDFQAVIDAIAAPMPLLFGTGTQQVWPPDEICALLALHGLALEPMSTGAAARTYNILIAERRPVAAALIAVP